MPWLSRRAGTVWAREGLGAGARLGLSLEKGSVPIGDSDVEEGEVVHSSFSDGPWPVTLGLCCFMWSWEGRFQETAAGGLWLKSGPTCSHFPGTGEAEGCPAAARVWGAARPGSDCLCI